MQPCGYSQEALRTEWRDLGPTHENPNTPDPKFWQVFFIPSMLNTVPLAHPEWQGPSDTPHCRNCGLTIAAHHLGSSGGHYESTLKFPQTARRIAGYTRTQYWHMKLFLTCGREPVRQFARYCRQHGIQITGSCIRVSLDQVNLHLIWKEGGTGIDAALDSFLAQLSDRCVIVAGPERYAPGFSLHDERHLAHFVVYKTRPSIHHHAQKQNEESLLSADGDTDVDFVNEAYGTVP